MSRLPKLALFRIVVILAPLWVMAVTPGLAKEMSGMADFPLVLAADLPKEARDTLHLIHQDGPFPYAKDGVVFSNREKTLPRQPRGFYHEYTVKTPGVRNRGALRIVCGGKNPPACYFSGDHYQTFKKIKE